MLKKSELKNILNMFRDIHCIKCNNKMTKEQLKQIYDSYLDDMALNVLKNKKSKKNIIKGSSLLYSMDKMGYSGGSIFSKLSDWVSGIKKKIFFPADEMPVGAKRVIDKYGITEIDRFEIMRAPIVSGVRTFLNVISLGSLSRKLKELDYDNIFHLSMVVIFKNGDKITIEKNERINIEEGVKYQNEEGLQLKHLSLEEVGIPKLTLNELLSNTLNYMGKYKFYSYSAKNNNCQDFILAILKSNNINIPEVEEFIKQDTQEIFKSLPSFFEKFSQGITDSFGRVKQFFGFGRILNSDDLCLYLKEIGYSISYDKTNKNYKFRFKGQSKGTSGKMANNKVNKNIACLQLIQKERLTM
jgi:hypothetical protein